MSQPAGLQVEPLGDQAVLVTLPAEEAVPRFVAALRGQPPAWLVDVVPAYMTVAIFFDPDRTDAAGAAAELARLPWPDAAPAGRLHRIPCCYERQLDLDRVAARVGLDREAVIALHAGSVYVVYAIGFCPGFPYLGYLPPALCGVPRLDQPRVQVPAGSVGLTGRQTGIYPLPRPGGWNLIGRTPLELVDLADGYFPLRPGDRVQFVPIDEAEYRRLEGERLAVNVDPGNWVPIRPWA
jgi:inhibitor of KinA